MKIIIEKVCWACRITPEEFHGGKKASKKLHVNTERNIKMAHTMLTLLMSNLGFKPSITKELVWEACGKIQVQRLIEKGIKEYHSSRTFRDRYHKSYMSVVELRNKQKSVAK